MKAKTQQITVKVNEENPEPYEVLAKAIIDVSNAFEKIESSQLKKRAILMLLQDASGCSMTVINKVLDAGLKLKSSYLKELKKS